MWRKATHQKFNHHNGSAPGGGSLLVDDIMEHDTEKIDQAILALLYLTLHDENRAWKALDWDVMNRLHEKGYISNPIGKAKSVAFSEEGLRESERLFKKLFAKG